MNKILYLIALISVFVNGCASDTSINPPIQSNLTQPSDKEIAWANKIIELQRQQDELTRQTEELTKQRQLNYKQMVEMANQEHELQDVVDAVENIKKEAKSDNQLTEWVANNQDKLKSDFASALEQTKQQRFESFGFKGEVLTDWVDDVAIQGKRDGKNILSVSEVFLWKNSDGSGGITRIQLGYVYEDKTWLGNKTISNKAFSDAELSALGNDHSKPDDSQLSTLAPASTTVSSWAPNNETINALYQAGIDIVSSVIEAKASQWVQE